MLQRIFGACIKYCSALTPSPSGPSQQSQQPGCTRYIYDTCVVVDCAQWSDAMNACTRAQFPDAEIRIQQSDSSLTGFCIVLRLQPLKAGWPGDYDYENDYEILENHNKRQSSRWRSILHSTIRLCTNAGGKWTHHVAGVVIMCSILHMAHLATRGFVTLSSSSSSSPQTSSNSSNTA